MKRLIFLFTVCLMPLGAISQQAGDIQKLIGDMLESLADKQLLQADYEELVNDLIALNQQPINLNTATKSDLEQLFFLTDYQIENFLYYRYTNGPLYSIYELQAVERMDSLTISNMLPFVVVEEVGRAPSKRVMGQIMARVQSTFQTPLGYKPKNGSVAAAYLGEKEKWMTRGRIGFGDRVEAGFTLEKDQGEQAFPEYFPAADFTSGFLRLNQPLKFIDTWIVGDYRLSFGQGLAVWTDMAFSKSPETAQLRRRPKGINSYTSVNESSFLRGTALQLKFGRWEVSPFVSYKKRDASTLEDSVENQYLSSLQETGYHRTLTELSNRYAVNELVYGGRIGYHHHLFQLETGYANWSIDQAIAPKEHLKDKYRFTGSHQESVWLSHSIFLNRLMIFGEVALQNQVDYGIYQGMTYNAGNDVVVSVAYRKYSRGYTAILSNPFSESSTPAGESGLFASMSFKPLAKLELKAFADVFSYDWLRYNVYRPSDGFEWFLQADYRINDVHSAYLRYKSSQKEINGYQSTANYEINTYQKDNIRLFYALNSGEKWRFQTQIEYAFYDESEQESNGWMAFQDIRFKASQRYSMSLRYVLFDIDDYDSRIYSYEPDVLYAFTIPAYLNAGSRVICNLSYSPLPNLRLWGRLAHTSYTNLDEIGSGNQLIKGHQFTEWKLQLQYRF
ncbi:helix-hairpin-helix domain-containing protein [Carboxylicivirga mesophila]|uniref:Helix-hairpin-helix domain-containing protein n=1 Tax=Carboxylicivirga mesophila TaxID=1166478 RepID=A0ABS5K5Q4_9BACT|nr:helix-hairpin-helix domain-containing protein [Carboxylicivirga mesophila]MBS2209851.1 helix-hairpin-helix domain-containing protein [Carboxylicivirga mesophila]